MSFKPKIDLKVIKESNKGLIYPVYISSRTTRELVDFCKSTAPKEALGFLLGTRVEFAENSQIGFTKIVDWVTGSVDSTHVSASFTTEGLEQANRYMDEKYGKKREQHHELPKIVGIIHSHPFNFEPEFSTTDLSTFLNFPYDADGNVFILVDPLPDIPYFKVFQIRKTPESNKTLQHVPWIEYSPIESDFFYTDYSSKLSKPSMIDKSFKSEKKPENSDPFNPPKIEKINSKDEKSKKKVNLREFF